MKKTWIAIALLLAGCQQAADQIVNTTMNRDGTCHSTSNDGAHLPWQKPVKGYSVREEHTDQYDRCTIEHLKGQ